LRETAPGVRTSRGYKERHQLFPHFDDVLLNSEGPRLTNDYQLGPHCATITNSSFDDNWRAAAPKP